MLDAFLEVACGRTKQAEAEARNLRLLEQLPTPVLHKIASGNLALDKVGGEGCWLDKFRGTPLLDQAIALEREELEVQMDENRRRQAQREVTEQFGDWDTSAAQRDEIAIRRKLLELELAGADMSDMGGQEGEDAIPPGAVEPPADTSVDSSGDMAGAGSPPPPENPSGSSDSSGDKKPAGLNPRFTEEGNGEEDPAAGPPKEDGPPPALSQGEEKPKAEKPKTTKITTVEKPTEEKERVDIKAAAARMRFSLAVKTASTKEAFGGAVLQGLKGMGQFAVGAGRHVAGAAKAGGLQGGLQAAGQAGRLGMQQAGAFARQNPGATAALVAAPAAGVGYAAGRQ